MTPSERQAFEAMREALKMYEQLYGHKLNNEQADQVEAALALAEQAEESA